MVWGMISTSGVGPLYRVEGNLRKHQYVEILNNVMLPAARAKFGHNFLFQHDNAPCHSSYVVKEWFKECGVNTLDWPAQSPDLNPIENLWKHLNVQLKRYTPSNINELWDNIQEIWYGISAERCRALVDSVARRLKACRLASGRHTKY